VVGGHQPRDDRLAEAGASIDDNLVPRTRHRIGGEEDPRDLWRHHALDHDRQLHRLLVEPLACAVRDGPVAPERGPAALHRLDNSVDSHDVEEGILLTGERRLRQVLSRRARAHSHRDGYVIP
jgi:hypothetical protein